jgi:hypothetical protein
MAHLGEEKEFKSPKVIIVTSKLTELKVLSVAAAMLEDLVGIERRVETI